MNDPRGLIKLQTGTKTFLLQPFFGVATSSEEDEFGRHKDPETPLKVFDNFSRFSLVLIDTTQQEKAVSFNISMQRKDKDEYDEFIGALKDGIEFAKPSVYGKRSSVGSEADLTGKAYSVKLYANPFKGMTPAQVLSEDPGNRGKLLGLYTTLQENVNKYKMNRIQMEAIQEAVTLFDKGELAESFGSGVVNLYQSAPKPNRYKKNPSGLCPVTELKVSFYEGDSYPFEIEIMNYLAPVSEEESGSLNVIKSQATSRVVHTFRISFGDMRGIVGRMERFVNAFYITHYFSCEKDALALEKRQKDAALR